MRFLISGGAGFIGSTVIRHLINNTDALVLNLDKLTYASNLYSLKDVDSSDRYQFVQADICDSTAVRKIISDFKPNLIMHLAAESHVDRSCESVDPFITTNINGTVNIAQLAIKYNIPMVSVSTDEVYGHLENTEG